MDRLRYPHSTIRNLTYLKKMDFIVRACRTLEAYIRCGVLSVGLARVRCGGCGHELLKNIFQDIG
jgi:uncharacterized ferredoxin-like protein